jgi:hypothetical protein
MSTADLNRVLASDRAWVAEARCRETDPSTFSPVDRRGRVDMPAVRRAAQLFCAGCPVLAECRVEAEALAEAGFAPQELLVAGRWWPQRPYRGAPRPPVDLIGGHAEGVAA